MDMNNEKNSKYGVTGPLSTRESTEEENMMSVEMDKYLVECGFFEGDEEGQKRERVLGKLNYMVKEFVNSMAKERNNDNKVYGGKIFTFGSYRLGVHDKGADIDALCIVPRHVTRKNFFEKFYIMLEKDKNIENITKVEEAFVPIIKFKFQGIPIDLVFARLNLPVIKDNINLLNDTLLKNMDEKCILSLNGSRVTDEILSLVPNVKTFHSALRCIKYWAKRRCIYGNSYGYFGGVAFSLCVARVAQLYPNVSSFVIVCKFFELFSSWKWPMPVILKNPVDLNYNLKVWDPKVYPSDKYHRMPVITPAYPSMCSTHNVYNSTQQIITKELIRANEILTNVNDIQQTEKNDIQQKEKDIQQNEKNIQQSEKNIQQTEKNIQQTEKNIQQSEKNIQQSEKNIQQSEKVGHTCKHLFKKLFQISDFFTRYKMFVQILTTSKNEENFSVWEGYVESKIRILGTKIEALEDISYAIPLPKAFRLTFSQINKININDNVKKCTSYFIAIDIVATKTKKVFIDQPVQEFISYLSEYDKKDSSMSVKINSCRRKDVQSFLKVYYGKDQEMEDVKKVKRDHSFNNEVQ